METPVKKKLFDNLHHKYRLVIMQDDTFEEKLSFKLSKYNVFIALGFSIIALIFGTTFIIAFTPLREYIPGYADVKMDKEIRRLAHTVDSLDVMLRQKEEYMQNLKIILGGTIKVDSLPEKPENLTEVIKETNLAPSKEDSLLRLEMEEMDQYNLLTVEEKGAQATSIASLFFFTPIRGYIVNGFNARKRHFGIDIVAKENEPVKATLDGTVLYADWTLETGYIIGIQHYGGLVSVYKHNSALVKKQGEYVQAGEVIAIVGGTGEVSTGPHLHFELWHNGNPVNPREYMTF